MPPAPFSAPGASTLSDTELPSQYNSAATEPEIADRWEASGVFRAHDERTVRLGGGRVPFVIFMPPPNVTAALHAGHALTDTVQDVLIRWRRMAGDEALYQPGTDHAGIATQNVVEKVLAREGTTRRAIGREAFVARTTAFVAETGNTILQQLRAIGISADWSRSAYTLSPGLSRAVREAFVRLYEEGLVYRGHRVIHWCPRCLTSLSDEEAEHADTAGHLYHIRYVVADDPNRALIVATTRPETLLGDVAVAVHPDDDRSRDLVGRRVRLPLIGVEVPVIADAAVDAAFGTGALKITPAHDANDFDIGRRHGFAAPVIMNEAAEMEEGPEAAGRVPAPFAGLDRFDARKRIVAALRENGLLVRTEDHVHAVRHCYRCDSVIEPRLSDQWFVRMAPLAGPALEAVRDGRIRIVPDRWSGVYVNWLENIRDWNISRQLWWGHRIPVWYCAACGWHGALREDPVACPMCGGAVHQDEDVFDTWFSSWLWPLSTLGWPDDTPAFRAFYPGDVLVTGPDILFFWVARMIMAGLHFDGRPPFHTVLLHGIVRDTQHRKMSKSLGNGIDPLDVVALYGADALRYTLIAGMGLGTDVLLDPASLDKSFAPGRNFVTKLWNIGRFLLINVGSEPLDTPPGSVEDGVGSREKTWPALTRADRWILDRLDAAVAACNLALGPARPGPTGRWGEADRDVGLRLSEYIESARGFVWNDLADWYLEHNKRRLTPDWDAADRATARSVLLHVFGTSLRLLHPVVPFVTEALWQRLPTTESGAMLAAASWPIALDTAGAASTESPGRRAGEAEYELVRQAVSAVRQLRADYNVSRGTLIDVIVDPAPAARDAFVEEADAVGRLSQSRVRIGTRAAREVAATSVLTDGSTIVVPLAGVIDIAKECVRLRTELARAEAQLKGVRQRLANEAFRGRAKQQVIDAEQAREQEWAARAHQLRARTRELCGE